METVLIITPLINDFVLFQYVELLLCFFVMGLRSVFNLNFISNGWLPGTIVKERVYVRITFSLYVCIFPHQALTVSEISNIKIPQSFCFACLVGGEYTQPYGDEQTKELSKKD
ncbi:hypothetical protein FBBNIHIM_10075 [Pseudocitrobacter vendiensis]|uniref:Uncharacterized protein n=1 Tax=Pseudocitrobacter vendiensis TaxID=2488306 RepID=A0ABN8T9N7_9ENTR|nr:hypothetical protein FBBNIHIM_10075 [Pseudocitrobacter vendiensis]